MVVFPIRSYLTTTVLCAVIVILTAVILQSYFTVTQDLDDTQTELVENNEYKHEQPLEQLTQTEKFSISFLESIIHGNESSLWPLVLFVSSEMLDQVAPAIIRMGDFAKLRQMQEDWYSKPFLVFNEGYRMCIKVYAGGVGDGKGTHVSVYLHLMKGEHDDKLEQSGHWPLRGTFIIELLNQLSDKDHHSHKMTFTAHTDDDILKE